MKHNNFLIFDILPQILHQLLSCLHAVNPENLRSIEQELSELRNFLF